MRCSVARLCERTVGRRVPQLGAGGGQLHTTPHCVVVTALLVRSRGALRPALDAVGSSPVRSCGPACGRKPHTPLRQGRERAEHFGGGQGTESRALRSAGAATSDVAGRSTLPLAKAPSSHRVKELDTEPHIHAIGHNKTCCRHCLILGHIWFCQNRNQATSLRHRSNEPGTKQRHSKGWVNMDDE